MKRRPLLASLAATAFFPFTQARAADWQISLVKAADGSLYGLRVQLSAGWKTYWRVPGEAGIPPEIKLDGKIIDPAQIAYPLPSRIVDASGEAIGYHDEVVFLLRPAPDARTLSAFFGICKDVCRPVKFAADLATASVDDAVLETWSKRVPSVGEIATQALVQNGELVLALTKPVIDIFILGPDGLYFRKPVLDGTTARLKIDGLKDETALKGQKLTLTAITGTGGLEQTISLH